jgi:hypothetical protein
VLIDFEDEEKPTSTFLKRLVALALIALLPIGATLASNISLGNNSPVEFGQGVNKLVTCAPNVPIFLKPKTAFMNSAGTGAHYKFAGISLEGIQNTCIGYDFVIRAYGESGFALPILDTNKTEIRIYQTSGNTFSTNANDGITFSDVAFGQFVATFDSPTSRSADVYRLTIETFPHDSTMLRYDIGDTGPGGGMIVLLPTSLGNNSGEYFEAKSIVLREIWCEHWPLDIPGTSGSAIGDGEANSYAMMLACNDTVANNASSYPGFPGDWFLPSRDELAAALNAGFVPLFGGDLWTSTQYDSDAAYTVSYPGRIIGTHFKLGSLPAVAMRSFP